MGLSVQITDLEGVTVIAVAGEVDVYTAPELRSAVNEAATQTLRRLVIDLTALDFIDSTGLGVLVAARQRAHERGIDLRLVCPEDRLLRIFRITRLDKIFDIRVALAEAVSSIPAGSQGDQGPGGYAPS